MRPSSLFLSVLLACGGKGEDSGAPVPQITGTLTIDGLEGEVALYRGFGMNAGGVMLGYLSSNPDADCDMIYNYLLASDEPYDPTGTVLPGTCDLFLRFSNYSGEVGGTDDPVAAAGIVINCALGDGAFELQTRDGDDTDYYWTGTWWQGRPTAFTFAMSGGEGEDFPFSLEMSAYDGNFIYEDMTARPGTGAVSGAMTIEWCSDLGSTGLI